MTTRWWCYSYLPYPTAASSSCCHRYLLLSVLSLAVLSCALNMMILGFTDHRSDLHFVVLGLSAISESHQVIVLGLMTRKKIAYSYELTNITLTEVWSSLSSLFSQSSNYLFNYLLYLYLIVERTLQIDSEHLQNFEKALVEHTCMLGIWWGYH